MWKNRCIGDVLAKIQNGINCKQDKSGVGNKITRIETIADAEINYEKTGFAQLTQTEMQKARLEENDILFSHINSPIHVGKTAIYKGEEPLWHGINLLRLKTIDEVDAYFFNYFLIFLFQSGYWNRTAKQSVNQASVNQNDIKSVPFSYPPLAEQQRIVAKLDAAFAEIDEAIGLAKTKEVEVKKLQSSILSQSLTYDAVMWRRVCLADVCTLRNGRAYKKPELLSEGKYKVLRVGNFFTSDRWYYSNLELDDTKYCYTGDLLYAWSASFGARVWEGEKVIYHYHIWRVDIEADLIDKKFLYYWFEFDKEQIKKESGTGTTMIHVSKGSMEKRELWLPPLSEQKLIVKKLDAAFNKIDVAYSAIKEKEENYQVLKSAILKKEQKSEAA